MQAGKVRIIAGQFGGRKLNVPKVAAVRPTTDRIRETVFNWLQPYIVGATCLDAFAGTGILGFEALSRGAQSVTWVEQDKKVCACLQDNLQLLAVDNVQLIQADFLQSKPQFETKFTLVFLDPPFNKAMLPKAIAYLLKQDLFAKDALLYLEQDAKETVAVPENFHCLKRKTSGTVTYSLWQVHN